MRESQTHLGLNFAFASAVFKCTKLGNSKIIFLPSSIIGLWQNEQRTLHGSWCSMLLLVGSYHSKSWCPCVKLMSSLWKIAAHWNGAAITYHPKGQQVVL